MGVSAHPGNIVGRLARCRSNRTHEPEFQLSLLRSEEKQVVGRQDVSPVLAYQSHDIEPKVRF